MNLSSLSSDTFASTVVLTDDFLYCPNCNKEMTHPKLLECLHSFCLECLKTCLETNNIKAGQYFCCPLCRTHCKVPDEGVNEMKDNIMVQSMLKFLDFRNNLLRDEKMLCSGCNAIALKISQMKRCMECDDWLCKKCCDIHNKVKMTKSHQLYAYEDLLSGNLDHIIKQHVAYSVCTKHSLKFSAYCCDCRCLLCLMCKTTIHALHETTSIEQGFRRDFEIIKSCLPRVKQTSESLGARISNLSKQQRNIDHFRKKFHKTYANRIVEVIDIMTNRLNSYADFLHRTVDGLISDRLEKFSKLKISQLKNDVEIANVAVNVSEQLLTFDYPQTTLAMKDMVCHQLTKFKKLPNLHIDDWRSINLSGKVELLDETIEELVGSLTYDAKPKYDTSLYSFCAKVESDLRPCVICDMALDSIRGEVVLIDEANKNLKVFDFEGCPINVSSETLLRAPIRVVITRSDEHYLVNDENSLKLVDKKLQKTQYFSSYKFRQPVAITQSTNGEILVAEWMSGEVIGFDEVGVLVRRFPCYSGNPAYLSCCLNSDHIILSDWGHHSVKIFHWNGNLIASYGQHGDDTNCLDHPHGVNSDAENRIIVCDTWNNRIEILDWKGRYLATLLDRKNGLLWPQAIVILREHCFVAERQGTVKVFDYQTGSLEPSSIPKGCT